jgi:hypothetical protein
VAELFGTLIVLLIPLLGVLYPMIRSLPRLYDWLMRSKITRIYGELRFLEDEIIDARRTGRDISAMVRAISMATASISRPGSKLSPSLAASQFPRTLGGRCRAR